MAQDGKKHDPIHLYGPLLFAGIQQGFSDR
jgi:hypothetical protein